MKRLFALCVPTALLVCVFATGGPRQSDAHHTAVNQRGDHVMGFSHEKATHHFRLYDNGGAIEVEAKDKMDVSTRDQIRMHLSHIAEMFANGNLQAPMLIHDQIPPGVPTLQRLKRKITYQFADTERGGRIVITTADPDALNALHEFLRFQISDHQTGDSTEVTRARAVDGLLGFCRRDRFQSNGIARNAACDVYALSRILVDLLGVSSRKKIRWDA
jgi:hypothetical protein